MKIKNSLKKVMVALSVLFAVTLFTATAYADRSVCSQTMNVECSRSGGGAFDTNFTFTNYNAYQVTVNADFTLVGENGTSQQSRTIVVPANGSKKVSFSVNELGVGCIKINSCNCTFTVFRCD